MTDQLENIVVTETLPEASDASNHYNVTVQRSLGYDGLMPAYHKVDLQTAKIALDL